MTENKEEIHIKSITQCRVETMYKTSCMMGKIINSTKLSAADLSSCVKERKDGDNFISKSVVPMWVVYQFFVSVVLLRILIVMLTITYNKILANLNNMWKYARLYLIIQELQCYSLMLTYIYIIIQLPDLRNKKSLLFTVLWCWLSFTTSLYISLPTDVSD